MKLYSSNLCISLVFTFGTLLLPFFLESTPSRSRRDEMVLSGFGNVLIGVDPAPRIEAARLAIFLSAPANFLGMANDGQPMPSYLEILRAIIVESGEHIVFATGGQVTLLLQALDADPQRVIVLAPSSSPMIRAMSEEWTIARETILSPESTAERLGTGVLCLAGRPSFCDSAVSDSQTSHAVRRTSLREVFQEYAIVDAASFVADYGPVDHVASLLAASEISLELTLPAADRAHLLRYAILHLYFGTMQSQATVSRAVAVLAEMLRTGLKVQALHGNCPWSGVLTQSQLDRFSAGELRRSCRARHLLSPCAVAVMRQGQELPQLRLADMKTPHASLPSSGWAIRICVFAVALATGCSLVLGVSKNWVGRRRKE